MLRGYLIGAALTGAVAATGGAYWLGRHHMAERHEAAVARLEAQLSEADARTARMAQELRRAEQEAAQTGRRLEDAARDADGADRVCLPRGSVRRVFRR